MQSLHRMPSTPSAARRCEGGVRIWRLWRARRAEWTACVREDVPNATAARKLSPRAVPVDDEEPMDRQMIANNEVSLASQPKRPMSDFPTERNSRQMRKKKTRISTPSLVLVVLRSSSRSKSQNAEVTCAMTGRKGWRCLAGRLTREGRAEVAEFGHSWLGISRGAATRGGARFTGVLVPGQLKTFFPFFQIPDNGPIFFFYKMFS